MGLRKGGFDMRYDAFKIFHHIGIGKAQDLIALGAAVIVSPRIIFDGVIVAVAIQFDYEMAFTTQEIGEIGADRHLATEFMAELSVAELLPEHAFRGGGGVA